MSTLHVVAFSGSLRKDSTNMGILKYAQANAPQGVDVTLVNIGDLPFYNSDLQEVPAAVQRFVGELEKADALLLGCPEYNYSLAPALKNALDWASRLEDNRYLSGKPVAITGAGGGMGTSRSQYHLRQVCVYLNLYPLNQPEVFSNSFSDSFDAQGNLVDESIQKLVVEQLEALRHWARTLKGGKA